MPTSDLITYLRAHSILRALSDDQLAVVAARAGVRRLAAGDVLFRAGDQATRFYIVRDGSIRVGVPAINGPDLEVQQLGPGEVLGWSWLIPPYRWTFEAQAVRDSTLVEFDGESLRRACEQDPVLGYAVMKIFAELMSSRLQAARTRMMEAWAPPGWA